MFIRLFAIAGCLWLMEIISSLFITNVENISMYLDLVPSSQGVLLFFITVARKDMIKSIYDRYKSSNNFKCIIYTNVCISLDIFDIEWNSEETNLIQFPKYLHQTQYPKIIF